MFLVLGFGHVEVYGVWFMVSVCRDLGVGLTGSRSKRSFFFCYLEVHVTYELNQCITVLYL